MAFRVVATSYGGPEVLSVVEVDLPEPGPGQVSVQVAAAGTNPIDVKLFSGRYGTDPSQLPMPLGLEVAGVVTAVGEGAEGPAGPLRPGDEVIAYMVEGGYASEVVTGGATCVPRPATFTMDEASGLLLAGTTAVHALTATGVGRGDTVVMHGAAGAVGQIAVRLAVHAGARVIGTASARNQQWLRELGAEPVTYGPGLIDRIRSLAPGGVDVALDLVGTDEALEVSVQLVGDRSRIATIANAARGLELGIRALGAAPGAEAGAAIRDAARMELVRQAEAGIVSVRVAATYPLAEAAEALGVLATGHAQGKIVLVP
jgi:NADPH2:quinone reductase